MALKTLTDESFENDVQTGVSVVDFWAEWCGPCRIVAPVFEELENEIENVKFFKLNVDENHVIADKYQITSIPTFLAFKDGVKIAKLTGVLPKQQLKKWILEHLK